MIVIFTNVIFGSLTPFMHQLLFFTPCMRKLMKQNQNQKKKEVLYMEVPTRESNAGSYYSTKFFVYKSNNSEGSRMSEPAATPALQIPQT